MTHIRDIDPADGSIMAEAGAVLADVQSAAEAHGQLFPLSLASEGSCRIGGILSTNAGGVNVIRYGNARDLCLGIEAVLPDGSVFDGKNSLRKDNTGYDLRHLLIGAEGTLGIITAARLKTVPMPENYATGLLQVPSPGDALALLTHLRGRVGDLISAFELIDQTGVDFLTETLPQIRLPPIGRTKWNVLLELSGGIGQRVGEQFESALAEAQMVTDGFIAQSEAQRQTIWTMRESIPLANRRVGAIASHDISIPISKLPDFIEAGDVLKAKRYPDTRLNCFGHLGDGNLHYNVFPEVGKTKAEYANRRSGITESIYELVAEFSGSFSAEHGIGRLKKKELLKYGDPGKIAAMRAIKHALDPANIMNPGAMLDL